MAAAASAPRAPRERLWFVPGAMIALAIACVVVPMVAIGAGVASLSVGPVTAGEGRIVFWRDYPGRAGLDPDDILAAPRAQDADDEQTRLVAELNAQLDAAFPSRWARGTTESSWIGASNGYSGSSMLQQIESSSFRSGTAPLTDDEDAAFTATVEGVAEGAGYTWDERFAWSDWTDTGTVTSDGAAAIETRTGWGRLEDERGWTVDVSLDEYRVAGSATAPDAGTGTGTADPDADSTIGGGVMEMQDAGLTAPQSNLGIAARSTLLLDSSAEAEFQRRLAGFTGLEQPEAVERLEPYSD